jgi:acyl carrier protein
VNQPQLTQSRFIHDPFSTEPDARLYKTGDLCCFLRDGNLQYFSRLDDQVKIRGYRIEPAEIEACLRTHLDVRDAVVVAMTDEALNDQRLVAYYIPGKPEDHFSENLLRRYLKHYLADYLIPTHFVRLTSFPLTTNGKLDKKALPLPLRNERKKSLPPRTRLEKSIAKIWEEELQVSTISLEDNFFELGGNSLSAARIISKINKMAEAYIKLDSLYHSPTIHQLADLIRKPAKPELPPPQEKQRWDKKISQLPLGEFQLMYWFAGILEPHTKNKTSSAESGSKGAYRVHP